MTGRGPVFLLRLGGALAMLALALTADARLAADVPFALALYVIPIIIGFWLPLPWAGALMLTALAGIAASGLLADDSPLIGMRGVMLLQMALIAVLLLALRRSLDEAARSNLRVARVLDGANTGFVATDASLVVLDANDPWLEMIGSPPLSEVVGTRLVDWLPEERRAGVEAVLGFLTPGDRRSFETTFAQRSGVQRFVVVTAYAEKVGDGVRLSAICADVTPIRMAEAKARASELQLRTHLEHTPLAAVVLDPEHHIRGWNRAAEKIFSMHRSRAIGRSAWELVADEDQSERTSPFSDPRAEAGRDGSRRVAQLAGDGRRVVVQWYHTPLRDASGEVTEVASLGLDVTAQEEVERALRESEAKFSSVFQQSPDSLLLVRRKDMELLEANATLERMFGWSISELRERWSADTLEFWVDPEHHSRFIQLALENERVEAFETELLCKDGSHLAVLCSSSHLLVDGERCYLITIRDLTAIREVEEERFRLLEQLQQAQRLESIGRLAGGVAHDFNNLLAGIQGYTELIDLARESPHDVGQYAARIMETTQRAADLVGKLLTFSRQGAMKKELIDIHDVVADMVDLFQQTLDARIRVVTRLDSRTATIVGDETQISNAILNLCVNARDALTQGGEIEVSTMLVELSPAEASLVDPDLQGGSYLLLQVRDDGSGIPPEALEQIFVPFFTTKPKGQGTGLGLPSVYGAMKAHGGTVSVASRLGEGSCFSLYLPVAAEQVAPRQCREVRSGMAASAGQFQGRVLVVDDEPGVRDTLERSLEQMGYTVEVAGDGHEAVTALARDPAAIDLVIMDVSMPQMSGGEAFRAMRALRPDLDVILMSGFDRRSVLRKVLGEGAAGVLKKPFTRDELTTELSRVAAGADAGADAGAAASVRAGIS